MGAFVGFNETRLEFLELAGDAAKTLASKVNIVPYDATQDPFNDKYNWASWNLGKDEIGAQTLPGQLAQGFAEYAMMFVATGGGTGLRQLAGKGLKGPMQEGLSRPWDRMPLKVS